MKIFVAVLSLAASYGFASGSIFQFKDPAGLEKCLKADHLLDEVRTEAGSEKRYLDRLEIQDRCIASAVKIASGEKSSDKVMSFVTAARRGAAPETSLPLLQVVASNHLALCNEMKVYEVFTKSLSYPPSNSDSTKRFLEDVKKAVKLCLRDKQFRKDFLEEMDSSNADTARNACEILKEEKLVKKCEGKDS